MLLARMFSRKTVHLREAGSLQYLSAGGMLRAGCSLLVVFALASVIIRPASAQKTFEYSVEKVGQVSAAVYDSDGRLQPIDAGTGKVQINKYNRKGRWDPLPKAVKKKIDRRKEVRFRYGSEFDRVAGADVAAHGSTLVISLKTQDSVRWLSKKDGSTRHAIEVPAPNGVAVGRTSRST